MHFAGKAYVKKKPIIPVAPIPEVLPITKEETTELKELEEVKREIPAPVLKRNRSIERLSISSLNHSLNSNSDSSSEEEKEERHKIQFNINPAHEKIELRVDTNVVSIDLGSLKEAVVLATGDPIFCQQCQAAFSLYSRMSEVAENQQVWKCEFCEFENYVNIEPEEMPRGQVLDYMIMSAQQVIEERKIDNSAKTVIFCIDVSGSMDRLEPFAGTIALKTKKVENLDSDPDSENYSDCGISEELQSGNSGVKYMSRLECVQMAIKSQLQTLADAYPDHKVGIVTFESDVFVFGDGKSEPAKISKKNLGNFEACFEDGISLQHKLKNTISNTHGDLLSRLHKLQPNGSTALGPALVASIGLASSGLPGSKVIVCTDGIANIGIGTLVGDPTFAEMFYLHAGSIAKEKGIEVSVVSIQGAECKLSMLSKVCEITGGEVTRVNSNNITNEFANILETPIIATQVTAVIKIHKGLCFRYQDDFLVDPSTLKRELGNIAEGSEFTFEYTVRATEELEALHIDLDILAQVPFQSQIHFTNKEGMRCMRVITALQDTIDDLDKAGDINFKVIGVNAAQRCAYLASKGEYRESQAVMRSWKRMMKRNANNEEQAGEVDYYLSNLANFNRDINQVAGKESMLNANERASKQNDRISHMAFRAKKANKDAKKDCVII